MIPVYAAFFALSVIMVAIIKYHQKILRMIFHKQRYAKPIIMLIIIIFSTLAFLSYYNTPFQSGSEDLVINMIYAARYNLNIDDRIFGLGLIFSTRDITSRLTIDEIRSSDINPELYNVSEYKSTIGLQGWIFYFMARYGLPRPLEASKVGCCLFLAIVLAFICYELYKKYGSLFSAVFYTMTITSSWITSFAPNLYFVEFTWFIPMLLGLVCLNNPDKRLFLYPLFFLAIVVRCACSYEYITVIMLSSIMFLVVEWICAIKKGKDNKKYSNSLLRAILMIGVMSLLGFAVTILIHSYMRGAGDILTGFKAIYQNDVLRRTFGSAEDFPEIYARSLNASVVDVIIRYLTMAPAGWFALFLLIATTVIMVHKHKTERRPLDTEFWLFIVSFITCISWFVLGKSHSYIHVQMNIVLWYMGYIQVCTYIVLKFVLNSDIVKSMLKQAASMLRIEVYRDI